MSKSPEDDGFLRNHGKELIVGVGSLAAFGLLAEGFKHGIRRLNEQNHAAPETEEPSDNS